MARLHLSGGEHVWLSSDHRYSPDPARLLRFKRAMSHRRPYLILMNVDCLAEQNRWTSIMTSLYFQEAVSYGFWPSFFSGDFFDGNYFTRAKCYNRDRHEFKKWGPVLKALNKGGWRAKNGAAVNAERAAHVESFGPDMFTGLFI